MTRAERTAAAIRQAMGTYKQVVLDERYFNIETGFYDYPGRVTHEAVLKLANVKSRSTLLASHHDTIRDELESFILELKVKVGKVDPKVEAEAAEAGKLDPADISSKGAAARSWIHQLSQTIIAQGIRIKALEQENAELRKAATGKVVGIRHSGKPVKAT